MCIVNQMQYEEEACSDAQDSISNLLLLWTIPFPREELQQQKEEEEPDGKSVRMQQLQEESSVFNAIDTLGQTLECKYAYRKQ